MSSSEEEPDEQITLFSRKDAKTNVGKVKKNVAKNIKMSDSLSDKKVDELWDFETLGLSSWLVDTCKSLEMREPTPVQQHCIPEALRGRPILASAPTGSGKTAAFALPILEFLAKDPYSVFAVVLSPTRELAFQIGEQFSVLGVRMRLRCATIVGGVNFTRQQKALSESPHVIVATPGRLAAHIRGSDPPRLSKLRCLVLDEADRMLENAFAEDLMTIIGACPKERQTMLYSATITDAVRKAANSSKNLFEYHVNTQANTPSTLDERYLLVAQQVKLVYLAFLIRKFGPELTEGPLAAKVSLKNNRRKKMLDDIISGPENDKVELDRAKLVIVFVSTCETCQIIGETLIQMGVKCSLLHSGLTQNNRLGSLHKFRSQENNILIATDVASRGLDIPQVDLVINYDVPKAKEDYIHRVGRTARAGRIGLAITLVTQYDITLVHAIENEIQKELKLLDGIDEEKDVLVLMTRVTNANQKARMRMLKTGTDESLQKRKRRRL